MAKEASKQSKFKHFILSPIRFLKKARQIYMKCVVECAGGYGYGAATPSGHHISHLPMTNSVNLNASRPSTVDEGQRELLRTVPIRNVGNETRLVMHGQRQPFVGYKYNRMKMSYSPEVRKMERIDEDQPCYFEEDQMGFKTHLFYLYPRRRSNVVNMRTVYNQRRLKDDMQDSCSSKKGDSV